MSEDKNCGMPNKYAKSISKFRLKKTLKVYYQFWNKNEWKVNVVQKTTICGNLGLDINYLSKGVLERYKAKNW